MDGKLKHLELIQGVINRLSTNSFLIKGWSVVLVSALVALSAKDSNVAFAILAFIPAVVFWGLDGYFLSVERSYCKHFDGVRKKEPAEIDFSMDAMPYRNGFRSWAKATFSKTQWPFHGALIVATIVVMTTQA